ncbi:hypothetical protein OAT18_00830 [Tenacibaculum sp.]|nr:hypothetical protein [Tenacibaculum sp.]
MKAIQKITFSDGVSEITGLRFIENKGIFTSALGSNEGASVSNGSLSIEVTNGDK